MKTAVVICPGRGTYTKTELGVLGRHFADKGLLANFDARRAALGQETLSALDGASSYSVSRHTRGDNASALIYAATLAFYVNDTSEDHADTRAFLERRIEGIMKFEKVKARVMRPREEHFSPARLLGRLRYPAR